MRLDLNAHQLIHGIGGRDSVLILSMPDVVHFVRPASPQMSLRVLQVSQTTFGDQDDEGLHSLYGRYYWSWDLLGSALGTSTAK